MEIDSHLRHHGIAVVGMACRYPQANTPAAFWSRLRSGTDCIHRLTREQVIAAGEDPHIADAPKYVYARGLLDGADQFDAAFFGFLPRDAALMDPQERLFMTCAWESLEDAGMDPETFGGSIGIFGGAGQNTYAINVLQPALQGQSTSTFFRNKTWTEKDHLAPRTAYRLNLNGPALTIQTACSTSLVAAHTACQSLLAYECDAALAGGASVFAPQEVGYLYEEGMILSPDGHCRPFDAEAQGTVPANGVGMVVLKRLEDALDAGDRIYSVIRGTAINNDGSDKIGYTAPSITGQARAVALAQSLADVDPSTIRYIEAHGTATALGDPIEVEALTQAFRSGTDARQFCGIGSVKSNIGHTDAAAGVAGLIKASLVLTHREIPPSLFYATPNPEIDFAETPFYVVDSLREMPTDGAPRRAAVSSFGLGGTNAHMVLEEAPVRERAATKQSWHILPFSAASREQVARQAERLADHLDAPANAPALASDDPAAILADAATTLAKRRTFAERAVVVARTAEEAARHLRSGDPALRPMHSAPKTPRSPVFLFPGGGAQYPGMGRDLYDAEPVYRETIDRCVRHLNEHENLDIRPVLFPENHGGDRPENHPSKTSAYVTDPATALPALVTAELAMARLWTSWGVAPDACLGHSVGEYVAACVAGVMTPEEMLSVVALRGRLFESLSGGAMLSVALSPGDLAPYLSAEVEVSVENGPSQTVVSGPVDAMAALEDVLAADGHDPVRLKIDVAAHSKQVEPVLDVFEESLSGLSFQRPQVPFVSNVTGTWIQPDEATSPAYWATHMRHTVRFDAGLSAILADTPRLLIEAGPGRMLSSLARMHEQFGSEHAALTSMRHPTDEVADDAYALARLGEAWCAGADLDLAGRYDGESRRTLSLPTYPFRQDRHWFEAEEATVAPNSSSAPSTPGRAPHRLSHEAPQPAVSNADNRFSRLQHAVRETLMQVSGLAEDQLPADATFVSLGFDSLFLTQVSQALRKTFGVRISFRDLLEKATTIDAVASLLDETLPADAFPAPEATLDAAPEAVPVTSAEASRDSDSSGETRSTDEHDAAVSAQGARARTRVVSGSAMERIVQQQLDVMQQQLDLLLGTSFGNVSSGNTFSGNTSSDTPASDTSARSQVESAAPSPHASGSSAQSVPPVQNAEKRSSMEEVKMFPGVETAQGDALTDEQRAYLTDLTERYTTATAASRRQVDEERAVSADPRMISGFKTLWKEMVYPIVSRGSTGARLVDVDENEYVDFTMGYGSILYGHAPAFLTEALREQLERGFELGPMTDGIGETARRLCRLTGHDRAFFVSTGSEAMMAAIRIARTVTGRSKIAVFNGAYHGNFDEVNVRPNFAGNGVVPGYPGIPASASDEIILVEYGDDAAFDTLREHADELAAVLVEPVQSRRPNLQPKAFLQELRAWTDEHRIVLVFDEMITGFRCHPGGAQAHFGVKADLAAYGKILGGGLPIGAVAGSSRFMDTIDGGTWTYGDDSVPAADLTYYEGTHRRHPLAMTAARAILQQLEHDGPELQERLNARTEALAERLKQLFAERGVDFEVVRFASLFRIQTPPGHPLAELFFYHMRLKGMYVWDQRNHFVSPAHSDADLDRFVQAARESLDEMIAAGVLDADPTAEPELSISGDGMPSVPVASAKKDLPLTDGQREIWTATQMEARANSVYNESIALNLTGAVNLDALESAAQFVVDRHEALRTTFAADGSAQTVHPSVQLPFDVEGVSQTDINARLQEQHAAPFDLEHGPLVRCAVFQVQPAEEPTSVLIWTVHHLVADGWSLGIILDELATVYTSLDTGTVPNLEPATPLDVLVDAQAEPMDADTKAFWTDQFAGFDDVLDLPLDAPRPAEKTYRGGEVVRTVRAADTTALAKAAQAMGTTLFSALLAGYGAFLGRITGQDDLVVGIPSALQYGLDGGDALVGHGVNVLPMRIQIDETTPFSDWVKSVQSKVLDAREHGQVTFGSLLNVLNVRRTGGRVPLVETILNLDAEQDLPAFSDLAVTSRNVPKAQATFDLAFDMLMADGELSIYARYNADILSRETVNAWLESFEAWMKNVTSNPSAPLAETSAVSEAQRRQLTEGWSQGWAEKPIPAAFLDEILTQQAQIRPDAVAMESRGAAWTYAEFDAVVHAMGEALQSRSVASGDRVALYAERTMHTVAAALAIMRIGGVYVPLDPSYPADRIAYILSDSGARVLAHATEVPEDLAQRAASTVDLSGITPDASKSAQVNGPERSLSDPAYIIYTSGSTGTPKGVEVPHRGIANLAASQVRMLELQPTDRVLQMAALGFDASVFEISKSICAGATLVIGERGERVAIEAVSTLLADTRTTVATLPPPLLGALNPTDLPDLRAVVVAGEACPQDVADRWGDAVMLFNGYGPTEATVCATMGRLRPGQPVTIGRPIDHVHVYILDANGHPVPPGAFGELCIGGPGVALGYVGRSEETNARFVRDPFAASGDARMYRTGDRCRWRLDGTIDFGGRIDDQLSIYGYRVEPGEVEGVLRAPDVVQDAAVRLHETDNGPLLAAYLVPDSDALDRHVESDLLRDEHNHQETFYAEAIREHTATDDANREARSADAFVNPTTSLVDIYEQTIDVAESDEWMQQNLDRIRALSPDRMLEIGCGTSEVLFTIAPSCSRYDATDLSASAVAYTRSLVDQPGSGLGHVTVQQRPADNFDGWEKDAFDLVYFGSVVQYFPNAAYLRDVLTNAAHVTAPGGTIYLADVNSHAFFDVLYTEGLLKKADGADSAEEVRERIERRLRRRNWLFLEPAFFAGLQHAIPELGGVQIRLRRAATQNQPAKYHYDVFLTMHSEASAAESTTRPTWHTWETIPDDTSAAGTNGAQSETDRLLSMLEKEPQVLAVQGVPNARVLPALRAFHALPDATGPVQPLKAALSEPMGVDPETVWMAGDERGYTVDIAWSEDGGRGGTFDVVFRKNDADGKPDVAVPSFPVETNTVVDRPLANDPAGDRDAMLIDIVRSRVNGLLPAYMRPARYVVMDVLPRTPNGKTDRSALPLLDAADAATRSADYQAPRTETERILVDVATEMLHVDRVGVHDDLFELGADSMLVFQICARVQTLGIPLRPQEFFQSKTIAGLAEGLARREAEVAREEKVREDALRERIKNMSPEQVREMLARKKESQSL